MASALSRSLGILNLERGLPPGTPNIDPRPGHLFNPSTFEFPVISETIEGAWADRVIHGDSSLEPAYIAAARRLVERGAIAISANCGFSIRHQAAVAAAVDVPVALSSLLLTPVLLRQLSPKAKVAIVTADSQYLKQDLVGLESPDDQSRIIIGGVEGGALWQNEMKRPPPRTDVDAIEADVIACISRLRNAHPEIRVLLFECTAFPTVAPAIRRITKLPVYDVTTLCRMTFESVD